MLKKLFYLTIFWTFFFLLNALLNIPEWIYILFQNDVFAEKLSLSFSKFFSYPQKSTLFGINGDFVLLFLPFLLIRSTTVVKIWSICAAILFLLLLYYNIYYYLYQSLYSVHPIFKHDWIIIKEILPTFLNELAVKKSSYWGISLGILIGSFACVWGMNRLLRSLKDLRQSLPFWIVGIILFALNFNYNKKKITNEENKYSEKKEELTNWIFPKMIKSWTLHQDDPLKHLKSRWLYDLNLNKPLINKPNIYLLFIESYGAVATLSDACAPKFDSLAIKLEQQLSNQGWSSTSNYSKSTVIGGRSWLALTTTMIGARIENQTQYSGLIENYRDFPHIIDFFNTQGYETIRASTMSSKDIDTLKMLTIPNRFWGFDQRKLFTDIPYRGFRYDYYGGIPDQYTLGYLQQSILDTLTTPYFFTFITMNSHGPWSNAPPITDNWQMLNELKNPFPEGRPSLNMSIFHYWDLMEYELKMLTNFITQHKDDNSVFIILGDHNPAGLEWKLFGIYNKWATPIHIISKDSAFVQSFEQHGFTPGMTIDTSAHTIMRHMGLYSLLTRQLLEHYGTEGEVLPEYLPWGLK